MPPTKDKPTESIFLEYLKNQLDNYCSQNIILRGDFNICLDVNIDTIGGLAKNNHFMPKILNYS